MRDNNNNQSTKISIWTAFLVIQTGAGAGSRVLLNKDIVTIGREKDVDIHLDESGVSRMHAYIQRFNEHEFMIFDKHSTNGTLVNSVEIEKTSLQDQDIITIGSVKLKFVSGDSPEQAYYDELYRQTQMDEELPVYNQHYFLEKVEQAITCSRRYHSEVALILFDVDKFREFNGLYGDSAGDAALVQLVRTIKKRIRDSDCLCRYGGQIFALVTPNTGKQQAYVLAEHIRNLVAQTPILYADTAIDISISLGVSYYSVNQEEEPCTKELLISQAKEALHQAKKSGRNKSVLFEPTLH